MIIMRENFQFFNELYRYPFSIYIIVFKLKTETFFHKQNLYQKGILIFSEDNYLEYLSLIGLYSFG